MKCRSRVLGFVVSALALAACAACAAGASVDEGARASQLSVVDERVLQGPPCSVEDPSVCTEGTMCASLDLDTGRRTLCVNTQQVCEQLKCAKGQCVMLESYPVQIRCAR